MIFRPFVLIDFKKFQIFNVQLYPIKKNTHFVASAGAENHMTAYGTVADVYTQANGTFVSQLLILQSFTIELCLTRCKHDVLPGSLCLACPYGYDTFFIFNSHFSFLL